MTYFVDVYGENKLMEMLALQPNRFNRDAEVETIINTFCALPSPENIRFNRVVNEGLQMLWAMYDLGRIHGIRAERKRRKDAAKKKQKHR